MSEEYSELTLLELALLEDGMDPRLVKEIEEIAAKYPAKAQLAFFLKHIGAYQKDSAYLLDKHQASISRYLAQLEDEVGKLLKNRLRMHI